MAGAVNAANIEIERRFLVRVPSWAGLAPEATREHLVQAYLAAGPGLTVRIRLCGERALLTVKGQSVRAEKPEVECDIDVLAARAILDAHLYTGMPIEKTRSTLRAHDLTWEVDQFEGANAGLVIAEVELTGSSHARAEWDELVDRQRPAWLGREITGEARFANSRLALHPFASWPAAEREAVLREIAS